MSMAPSETRPMPRNPGRVTVESDRNASAIITFSEPETNEAYAFILDKENVLKVAHALLKAVEVASMPQTSTAH